MNKKGNAYRTNIVLVPQLKSYEGVANPISNIVLIDLKVNKIYRSYSDL